MWLVLAAALSPQSHASSFSVPSSAAAREREPDVVVAGGSYTTVPIAATGDEVPLPNPAIVVASPDGDREVEPASGDPYFLGFVAGKHYPPADERVDPALLASLRTEYGDSRPTNETYAFVMFSRRITDARLDVLRGLGARVLEFHPHYCMKVALTPEAIDSVSALDFVRWIGLPRAGQKVHSCMPASLALLRDGKLLDVYVNLYESDLCERSTSRRVGTLEFGGPDGVTVVEDPNAGARAWMSNGWQQEALQRMGIDVYEYVDSIRAFRARIAPSQIEQLVALDFVQFVEPDVAPTLGHDESMPMILADGTRTAYDGAGAAVAGQVDSGIDYSHSGITGYYWWAANLTGSNEATTDDPCEHGTHVAGTIHGSGAVEDSFEGVANGLGNLPTTRYFNTKIFYGAGCDSGGSSLATILGAMDSAVTDGSFNVTPRPHAINHSWGAPSPAGGSFGTEANCRTIDASVFVNDQLQVIIAHNWGPGAGTVSREGSSKNALTVGGVCDYASGVEDPGEMYSASGRGPTADNRWKPNVVAPATSIRSARAGTGTGYVNKSGTSMAAPHVTGLASQLTDHYPFLRHNPTTLGALLMASAMTKDDQLLTAPSMSTTAHLNNFGAGRVEAYKAHYGLGGGYLWGWTQDTANGAYVDVTVSAGATRIAVCMYYHEVAASAGASAALVNDLDLWIDAPTGGISATTNTGEYSSQQSPRDNTEIRLLNNPGAGTWRIKVHPDSATSNCQVGLAVLVHYDDTTPMGTFNVTASDVFIKPDQNVNITATATNPEYIASAVYFDSTSSGDTLVNSTGVLDDGATANYMNNQKSGRDVLVGDIKPNDSRSVTWTTRWATEGLKSFSVEARSDNWVDLSDSISIYVDGTVPSAPSNLTSPTHPLNTWVSNSNPVFNWTEATDNLSGIDGYGEAYGISLFTAPDILSIKDMENVTTFTRPIPDGTWYWGIKAVDNSGNWSNSVANYGPFRVDVTPPTQPGVISSSTHSVGVQSCDTSVGVSWAASTDSTSGLASYLYAINTLPAWDPVVGTALGAGATGTVFVLPSSSSPRYFHLRAVDGAGNRGPTRTFGPLLVNATSVGTYCTAKTNSLGCLPTIFTNGVQPSKSAGNFQVRCFNVLNQKSGLLFWGASWSTTPFQGGYKCVGNPTVRTVAVNSGGNATGNSCTGSYSFGFTTAYMNSVGLNPGDTVYAQWWMRDPASASTTGLSNAMTFTVCQ
ncbi:MAG: hypothetical protein FJW86_14280 [Actinobacteria bacterium]|nr:hypothetical protein [Actinomycetota bacterium]